jgi:hypothetical protein
LFYTFRNHNIKEQTGVNDQSLASWGKTQRLSGKRMGGPGIRLFNMFGLESHEDQLVCFEGLKGAGVEPI